jgi:DNA-binding IclR family transcriptional regulator
MPNPKTKSTASAPVNDKKKYSAPALEKGLQILETIAAVNEPLGPTAIAKLVGRNNNEIVRLLYVLEDMGFIERDARSTGYQITSRLFTIASARPATRSMLEVALPLMRDLAASISQSCHISVRTETKIVVIGRVEAHRGMSLSVRVGHNRSIIGSASGTILFGFLKKNQKAKVLNRLNKTSSDEEVSAFIDRAELAFERGFEKRPNNLLQGIKDYSVPVFRSGSIGAALTTPFVPLVDSELTEDSLVSQMKETADRISALIPPNEDY